MSLGGARALCALACAVALAGCKGAPSRPRDRDAAPAVRPALVIDAARPDDLALPPPPPVPDVPLGLPDKPAISPGPDDAAAVALGRILFFDARLSKSGALACASCHDPDKGWSDGRERSLTDAGKPNLRHTPALVNLVYAKALFWDGRLTELDATIEAHWKGQMLAGASPESAVQRVAAIPAYAAHFRRAFGRPPGAPDVIASLSAFVRTLFSGDSPWDRYEAGDRTAVTEDAVAGFAVFSQTAQCVLCHPPPLYTDGAYHDIGVGAIGQDLRLLDAGRALVTGEPADEGAFKTPTLRGAARSAPYYHDGSGVNLVATLDHGLRAVAQHAGSGGAPVVLTSDEVRQLVAFVQALTPEAIPYTRPRVPTATSAAPAPGKEE